MTDQRHTEIELTQFLLWLSTEKNIALTKDEGVYQRGVYQREYKELAEQYLQWRDSNSLLA